MPIPAIIATGLTVAQTLPTIKGLFGGGPSVEFASRQTTSNEFFALRNEVFSLEPYMSPELLAEWKSLSLHRADYNTRRENETERQELSRFVQKLNAYLASAQPDSRLLTIGPSLQGAGQSSQAAAWTLGGPILLAAAGLLAFLLFRKW